MGRRIATFLDGWHQRRATERWARIADTAGDEDSADLRAVRADARGMRRQLDRVLQIAEAKLAASAASAAGPGLQQAPLGTDWVWRPEAWSGAVPDTGVVAAGERTAFGENLAVYHDCPLGEVVVRQIPSTKPDMGRYGLAIDVFGFRGTFLSLAVNLPEDATAGMTARHLVRAEFAFEADRPIRSFARLNVKHGPNLSQPVSTLPGEGRQKVAEFDLAHADINDRRIERAWLDLIMNDVGMTRIHIRDVVISRRPRAEL